ncbi:immunoglobulin superfamily member 1-like isoform X1 [Alosa sapidissima]|uniref:immunoglobulin superfamily member 1-like isoform X1 n=1 Tax=Alosa sapidissima TaxID=34773 RepID=UPI001C098D40|nr:immunoglobulin superfamily member 1-like isoform X1 [Alosa sapidissima]
MGEMSMSMAVLALVSVISVSVPSAPVAAQIRLVNGKSRCSGRVEVYLSNQWGTVCDDGWDMSDAEVVCRELGCGCAINAPWSAFYGAGTGYILMDDVACSLTEQSLTQCSYNSNPDCKHEEDVGVACTATGPSISLISSYSTVSAGETVQIRCSRSASRCNGNLLLYRNGVNVNSKALNSSQSSATFTLSNVDSSHQGSYTCAYSSSSTHSRSINITVVVGLLQKPSIFLETSKEVSWGRFAQMRCSISTQHLGGTFTLQQLSGSFTETKISTGTSALFTIPQVDFIHEGDYYCRYQTRVSRREFTSPQSATVSFSVIVVLEQPILSLGTSKEVSWGQSAQMRCSISTQHLGGTFTLQQLSGSFKGTKISTGASALFTIPQVDFIHEGAYNCQYKTRVSTREFTSPQSATVSLSVIVVLVQPNISLSAPDGGLFWGPQGPEVTRGHSLSLICSSEPQHQGGSFHLIFDGSNRTRTQLAINHSASFYIPEADYSHQGNYSCVYEVTVSSRTFNSTQTAPLTVIVRASLAPIIASGVISGLFLLLLIPAILYLVKKKHLGSANTYRFHNGPGESRDEGENIYIYGDLEEDMNVEELHGPTVIDNDYDEDD